MGDSFDSTFDVAIIGTGLSESILAAALAKAQVRVLHLDSNDYYGSDQATFTTKELDEWGSRHAQQPQGKYRSISKSTLPAELQNKSREFSITLGPSIIPSTGPLIDTLINSGVARYGGFRLLQSIAIYDQNTATAVPSSKEDVFKSKEMSLIEKRKLMRFLLFAAGEFEGAPELEGEKKDRPLLDFVQSSPFSLPTKIAAAVTYAVAQCTSPTEPAMLALQRTRRFLRSAGRYGNSAFLVGHYGGLGELSQGFCRTCAVNGGVYILGREIKAISHQSLAEDPKPRLKIELEQFDHVFTTSLLVSPAHLLPPELRAASKFSTTSVARCVAVIGLPIAFASPLPPEEGSLEASEVDTSVVVFPPGSLASGNIAATTIALIAGEGSMSCPSGKFVVYISASVEHSEPGSAESLLSPYLLAILALTSSPSTALEYQLFYFEDILSSDLPTTYPTVHIMPSPAHDIAQIGDSVSQNAEQMYRVLINILRPGASGEDMPLWPPLETPDEGVAGEDW